MTLNGVVQELLQCLGSEGDTVLAWEQIREWPKGAIEVFQNAGWITPTILAESVECPGCEENCFKPVDVFSAQNGQPMRALVGCDERDDIGKVKIPLVRLQQWQLTLGQLARWVTSALDLRGKLERDGVGGTFNLGALQGKERVGLLELDTGDPVCLRISGHSLRLSEAVFVENGEPIIDRPAILAMVDLPLVSESSNRYQPSTARREARKLDTQAMYETWQKEYRKLKRKNPKKSDQWCSLQIGKLEVARGRDPETIRKHMKK